MRFIQLSECTLQELMKSKSLKMMQLSQNLIQLIHYYERQGLGLSNYNKE